MSGNDDSPQQLLLHTVFNMRINMVGIDSFIEYFGEDYITRQSYSVKKFLSCPNCSEPALSCVVCTDIVPGPAFLLQCRGSSKRGPNKRCANWYCCGICKKLVTQKNHVRHFSKTALHQTHKKFKSDQSASSVFMATDAQEVDNSSDSANIILNTVGAVNLPPADLEQDDTMRANSGSDSEKNSHNNVHDDTDIISTQGRSQDEAGIVTLNSSTVDSTMAPKYLKEAFFNVPRCSLADLTMAFADQIHLKLYHAAERESTRGGIQYLVTRSFQKSDAFGLGAPTATQEEAEWHFDCFVQYMGLTGKQRSRQVRITLPIDRSMFQATRLLRENELNRFYGRSNKHTLWHTQPIPKVENIAGIAYMSPLNAVRYWFANSTEVDDTFFKLPLEGEPPPADLTFDPSRTVHQISQCKVFNEWKRELYDAAKKNMPESFSRQYPHVLMCWAVDWRDGFGANRTKQNRKSTNAWTFSLATPQTRINSLSNTLPIALGLKKNENWKLVEYRFLEDTKLFANGLAPFMVYHGKEKKIIPVFIRRIACLTDKVERGDYTSTISCTSKYHRCFGKIIRFEAPTLDTDRIKLHIDVEKKEPNTSTYGWSCDLVNRTKNGGRFPACLSCRKRTVQWLREPDFQNVPNRPCLECANWVLSNDSASTLPFAVPKD